MHRHFVALLLFKKADRIGLCYIRLMTSQVIPSVRPIPTQFVRREFYSPPIIRDRAGAIRPDFSVCVEGRCMLVGRASSVIVAFSFNPGKRKGSWGLLLRLTGKTDCGNLRWCLPYLLGFDTLRARLACTERCSPNLELLRGPFPHRCPLIHPVFERRLAHQTHSVWQVARQIKKSVCVCGGGPWKVLYWHVVLTKLSDRYA